MNLDDANCISPPGGTIEDILEYKELSREWLADKLGSTVSFVDALIKGQVEIDEGLALDLSKILSGSVDFWLAREANYRKALRKRKVEDHTDCSKNGNYDTEKQRN